MKQPLIQMQNVDKFFGKFQALKDINLEVQKGEKIVVCGPSGSGKSTMIRCINRLEKHNNGRIFIDGKELTDNEKDIDAVRREVGMVFQSFNLFPHMTVLRNLMLAPRLVRKNNKTEAKKIAMKYLERVKIPDQADKYPSQLSGGQQQRVAIARALCMSPEILLFDEPTSALDVSIQMQIIKLLTQLQDDLGLAYLCISHDLRVIRALSDLVYVMKDGEVVESGSADKIFDSPSHPYTQELLQAAMA